MYLFISQLCRLQVGTFHTPFIRPYSEDIVYSSQCWFFQDWNIYIYAQLPETGKYWNFTFALAAP